MSVILKQDDEKKKGKGDREIHRSRLGTRMREKEMGVRKDDCLGL